VGRCLTRDEQGRVGEPVVRRPLVQHRPIFGQLVLGDVPDPSSRPRGSPLTAWTIMSPALRRNNATVPASVVGRSLWPRTS
jgi:hypothetical protein